MYLDHVLFAMAPTQLLCTSLTLSLLPSVEAACDFTGPKGTPEGLNCLLPQVPDLKPEELMPRGGDSQKEGIHRVEAVQREMGRGRSRTWKVWEGMEG
jgi:hypothetical protein